MIEVRHIEKTSLDEEAYLKLCKKYIRGLKKDIIISFDLRVKNYGLYGFYKNTHNIKISPTRCKFDEDNKTFSDVIEKYNLISTTIHEVFHAQQKEVLGFRFYSEKFHCISEISNSDMSEWYSKCEVDARAYENKYILSAVKYYDSLCFS